MVLDLDLGASVNRIVGVVLGVVVVVIVLTALAPTFFGANGLAGLVDIFASEAAPNSTGDATADAIKTAVFPIIIALTGLFLFAGLAIRAFRR